MSFKEAAARARANRPEPVLVEVAVEDELFNVEVRRLDGMDWSAVMAECPPETANGARYGYEPDKAALVACRAHSRLLDADGEPVDMPVLRDDNKVIVEDAWADLFSAISGVEIGHIGATWWGMNMKDPNDRVVELKKASAGGGSMS